MTEARRFVRDALAGIDESTRSEIAIMVSELAANAVLHAKTDFTVRVRRPSSGVLRVEVVDHGPGEPKLRRAPAHQLGGRGLRIVAEFADDWGIGREGNGSGKTVWFSVATTPRLRAGARSSS